MTLPPPQTASASVKAPAPGLNGRAPRPPVVRLRRSVVQIVVGAGCILLAGSLAWAFVIQPELRDAARSRAVQERDDPHQGAVRPADVVVEQPATYDRLPEPRGAGERPEAEADPPGPTLPARPAYANAARPGAISGGGPDPRQLAVRSAIVFEDGARRTDTAQPAPVALRSSGGSVRHPPGATSEGEAVYNRHVLTAPRSPYEIKAGALIPAVLLTAVDTSRPGPVIATVTQNIYDTVTGRHLLLPQGTRLIGRHEGDSAYGDRRAFLSWERLLLPNGKSLVLDAEPGVDAQGATGVAGRVDRRLGALAISTLFAGAVTTLGQAARDESGRGGGSFLGDAGDAAAIEGARVGGRLIDRELDVRPAIRVRAGGAARVLITRDLILEPYAP